MKKDKSDIKKHEVIHFLDSEIELLQLKIKRQGWTNWAIMGSIATLIWLLIDILELQKYHLYNIFLLILIVSILIDTIMFINSFFLSLSSDFNNKFRLSNQMLPQGRFNILLMVTRYTMLITGVKIFNFKFDTISIILLYVFNGSLLFTCVILAILSFLDIPFPENFKYKNWKNYLGPIFMTATGLLLIYKLANFIFYKEITISDVRISLLSIAVYILIFLFFLIKKDIPLLNNLSDIRKQITFDEIPIIEATKQIDIIMTGLTLPDALQKHISSILKVASKILSNLTVYIKEFGEYENLYSGSKGNLSVEQKEIADAIRESLSSRLKEIEEIIDKDMPRVFKPLLWRIYICNNFTQNDEVFKLIREKFDSSFGEIKKQISEIKIRSEKFTKKYDTGLIDKIEQT